MAADLARELVAHPRCPPGLRFVAGPNDQLTGCDGVLFVRRPNGVRMVDAAPRGADDYEWLPDLGDDATAGVLLLGVLGPRFVNCHRTLPEHGAEWMVRYRAPDDRVHTTRPELALGEAAARAVLALWSALDAQEDDRG